jgi:hypothetical protein
MVVRRFSNGQQSKRQIVQVPVTNVEGKVGGKGRRAYFFQYDCFYCLEMSGTGTVFIIVKQCRLVHKNG